MTDAISVSILVGLVAAITLYMVHRMYPNATLMVFSILMLILSGTGYYITEGTNATQIFEIFIILSAVGTVISFLYLVALLFSEIGKPLIKQHGGQKDY